MWTSVRLLTLVAAHFWRRPDPKTTNTVAPTTLMAATMAKTLVHCVREWWPYVSAPTTWGANIDTALLTAFARPIKIPASDRDRSMVLAPMLGLENPIIPTDTTRQATIGTRRQSSAPGRTMNRPDINIPTALIVFLTNPVDNPPLRNSRSASCPLDITIIPSAIYGSIERKPFSVMPEPKTSLRYIGRHVRVVMKPHMVAVYAPTQAHTCREVRICLHGVRRRTCPVAL